MAAFTHVALGSYVLARYVRWRDLTGRDNRALAGTWALALIFGIGLACAQWIPTAEMVMGSLRSDLPQRHRTTWSLHPLALAQVFFPVVWAQLPQVIPDVRETIDLQTPFLPSVYFGIPALALAIPGMLVRLRGRTLALLAAAALLYALGRHTVFYDVLAFLIPPLRVLRYPVKAMVVFAFAGSLLVGLGYDVWRRASSGRSALSRSWSSSLRDIGPRLPGRRARVHARGFDLGSVDVRPQARAPVLRRDPGAPGAQHGHHHHPDRPPGGGGGGRRARARSSRAAGGLGGCIGPPQSRRAPSVPAPHLSPRALHHPARGSRHPAP